MNDRYMFSAQSSASPSKVAKFERLFAEGWDASLFGELEAPD